MQPYCANWRSRPPRRGSEGILIVEDDPKVRAAVVGQLQSLGYVVAEESVRRWPGLRVVFMSDYTEDAVVHHDRLDAGVLLLSKPFRKNDLAQILRQALDGVFSQA